MSRDKTSAKPPTHKRAGLVSMVVNPDEHFRRKLTAKENEQIDRVKALPDSEIDYSDIPPGIKMNERPKLFAEFVNFEKRLVSEFEYHGARCFVMRPGPVAQAIMLPASGFFERPAEHLFGLSGYALFAPPQFPATPELLNSLRDSGLGGVEYFRGDESGVLLGFTTTRINSPGAPIDDPEWVSGEIKRTIASALFVLNQAAIDRS